MTLASPGPGPCRADQPFQTCVDPADRLDDGPGTPQGQRKAGIQLRRGEFGVLFGAAVGEPRAACRGRRDPDRVAGDLAGSGRGNELLSAGPRWLTVTGGGRALFPRAAGVVVGRRCSCTTMPMLANNSNPRLFSGRSAEPGLRRPESRRPARRRPVEPGDRPRPGRRPVPGAGAADIHHPCGGRSCAMMGRSWPASTPISVRVSCRRAAEPDLWERRPCRDIRRSRAGSLTRREQGVVPFPAQGPTQLTATLSWRLV